MSSLFGINSWIGALKAGQIGPKSARIVLIPPKIIGKRLFPCLNWQGSIEAHRPEPLWLRVSCFPA